MSENKNPSIFNNNAPAADEIYDPLFDGLKRVFDFGVDKAQKLAAAVGEQLKKKPLRRKCQLLDADGGIYHYIIKDNVIKFLDNVCGGNMRVTEDGTIATRIASYEGGCVFLDMFLKKHKIIEIKIKKINKSYLGDLELGLTSRDLFSISHEIHNRLRNNPPETYVFPGIKGDVGDSIFLWLLCTGELQMKINGRKPEILCKLDSSNKYALFIDVCNSVEEITAIVHDTLIGDNDCLGGSDQVGIQDEDTPGKIYARAQSEYPRDNPEIIVQQPNSSAIDVENDTDTVKESLPTECIEESSPEVECSEESQPEAKVEAQCSLEMDSKSSSRCVVCMEEEVDAVLYKCGHKCMCYNCGREWYIKGDSRCPMCRMIITDVIKIFE